MGESTWSSEGAGRLGPEAVGGGVGCCFQSQGRRAQVRPLAGTPPRLTRGTTHPKVSVVRVQRGWSTAPRLRRVRASGKTRIGGQRKGGQGSVLSSCALANQPVRCLLASGRPGGGSPQPDTPGQLGPTLDPTPAGTTPQQDYCWTGGLPLPPTPGQFSQGLGALWKTGTSRCPPRGGFGSSPWAKIGSKFVRLPRTTCD